MDPVPPSSRDRAPTIRDVARHAKVGVGTVSRVLNDSPLVSEDARRRVHRTIDELGYRRSSTARNLSLGRTQMIGVVAPFFTSASVLERLRGVVGQLREPRRLRPGAVRRRDADSARRRVPRLRPDRSSRRTARDVAAPDRRGGRRAAARAACRSCWSMSAIRTCRAWSSTTFSAARWRPSTCSPRDTRRSASSETSRPRSASPRASSAARGWRARCAAPGSRRNDGLREPGAHGREPARELAERLLQSAGPPDRDLRGLGRAGDGRARDRPGQGASACPQDLAVIGFDDIEVADVLGPDHGPSAAARDRRARGRAPAVGDRRRRRRADRGARAADRDRRVRRPDSAAAVSPGRVRDGRTTLGCAPGRAIEKRRV